METKNPADGIVSSSANGTASPAKPWMKGADAASETNSLQTLQQQTQTATQPAGIREDQVQNAVAFLSHPKVVGASDETTRAFLQRKGLTDNEIAAARARLAAAPPQPAAAQQPVITAQQQPVAQHIIPAQPMNMQHAGNIMAQPPQRRFYWTHVVMGAGVVAAASYAVYAWLWPSIVAWLDAWQRPTQQKLDELHAAVERAAAQQSREQQELREVLIALRDAVDRLSVRTAQHSTAAITGDAVSLPVLQQELAYLSKSIQSAMSTPHSSSSNATVLQEMAELKRMVRQIAAPAHDAARQTDASVVALPFSTTSGTTHYGINGGMGDYSSKAAYNGAGTFSGTGGYGWGRDGARSGHDGSPLSDGSTSQRANGSGLAGGVAGVSRSVASSTGSLRDASSGAAPQYGGYGGGYGNGMPAQHGAPSASYMEVVEMLEKGITPPGIRTDINDKPRFPDQQPSESLQQRRPKPWEAAASTNGTAAGYDRFSDPLRPAWSSPAATTAPQHNDGYTAQHDTPTHATHTPSADTPRHSDHGGTAVPHCTIEATSQHDDAAQHGTQHTAEASDAAIEAQESVREHVPDTAGGKSYAEAVQSPRAVSPVPLSTAGDHEV